MRLKYTDAVQYAKELLDNQGAQKKGDVSILVSRSLLKTLANGPPSYSKHPEQYAANYVQRLQSEIKDKDARIKFLEEQLNEGGRRRHEERGA